MTLRWRLTLFYTSLLAMLLLIIAVSVVWVLQNNLERNVRLQLQNDYVTLTTTPTRYRGETTLSPDVNAVFLDYTLYASFDQIVDINTERVPTADIGELQDRIFPGQSVTYNLRADNSLPKPPLTLDRAELQRLQRAGSLFSVKSLQLPDQQQPIPVMSYSTLIRFSSPALFGGGEVVTVGIIHLARDLTEVYRTVRQLQLIMLLVSLFGVLLAGMGAYALAGRALRPLRQVRKAAESISEKTLGQRVPEPNTGDEVEALAHALNGMLGRIERSFEVQRRFTSDASHELRTPVTAISGHAGYLLRRTQPTPQQAESINIIKNEADRLSGLIASLLELARSDSGVMQLRRQRMLSKFFLEDIARELMPLAAAQGAQLQVEGEDVEFSGDPDRLRQVVLNLVSNALRAGSTQVTLLSSRVNGLLLQVRDNGPGIASEHLGRLFDRFYRVEESRSRDQGGSGLGLAIVKAIVDAHHGRLWVESEVGRGTTVFVELPIGPLSEQEQDADGELA